MSDAAEMLEGGHLSMKHNPGESQACILSIWPLVAQECPRATTIYPRFNASHNSYTSSLRSEVLEFETVS
jgi:hypothetical protein